MYRRRKYTLNTKGWVVVTLASIYILQKLIIPGAIAIAKKSIENDEKAVAHCVSTGEDRHQCEREVYGLYD